MGCTAPPYQQRRARDSPLWVLLDEHAETVKRLWSERFEDDYGPWRKHWQKNLHKAPLSLGRMEYERGSAQVIYHGAGAAEYGRGTVAYDPIDFVALVLVHVPTLMRYG